MERFSELPVSNFNFEVLTTARPHDERKPNHFLAAFQLPCPHRAASCAHRHGSRMHSLMQRNNASNLAAT